MVQFLSINFFSWISSIFVGVFKISRFFVSFCTNNLALKAIYSNKQCNNDKNIVLIL